MSADELVDIVSSVIMMSYKEKLDQLNTVALEDKLKKTRYLLDRQIETLRLSMKKEKSNMDWRNISRSANNADDSLDELEKTLK